MCSIFRNSRILSDFSGTFLEILQNARTAEIVPLVLNNRNRNGFKQLLEFGQQEDGDGYHFCVLLRGDVYHFGYLLVLVSEKRTTR